MQKFALRIILPDYSYESALVSCGLPTLLALRDEACRRFISNIKESGILSHLLPQPTNVVHEYGLRSGFSRSEYHIVRTDNVVFIPCIENWTRCMNISIRSVVFLTGLENWMTFGSNGLPYRMYDY